jgi:hypothetical protein
MDVKTEEWRTLHNEELRDPYSVPNIIRVIKTNEVGRGMCHVRGQERCIQGSGGEI